MQPESWRVFTTSFQWNHFRANWMQHTVSRAFYLRPISFS